MSRSAPQSLCVASAQPLNTNLSESFDYSLSFPTSINFISGFTSASDSVPWLLGFDSTARAGDNTYSPAA